MATYFGEVVSSHSRAVDEDDDSEENDIENAQHSVYILSFIIDRDVFLSLWIIE